MKFINEILIGDCKESLKSLEDNSIDCCITSPPYFGLRDYGHPKQIGLENSIDEYVSKLVSVFAEVKRVLKDDGTLWLNLGDSYAGSGKGFGDNTGDKFKQVSNRGSREGKLKPIKIQNLKNKDLIGIPWRVAFALQSDGWYLRQDIIWSKPNPMPESVTDRCTKAHEYIFLLSKSEKYYYDNESIKTPLKYSSINRLNQNIDKQDGSDRIPGKSNGKMKAVVGGKKHKNLEYNGQKNHLFHKTRNSNSEEWESKDGKANKRSVWEVPTSRFKEAHFATFPVELIAPCVIAGCPKDGIILDPFGGSGTTAIAALKYVRNFILCELNNDYVEIARKRIHPYLIQKKIF